MGSIGVEERGEWLTTYEADKYAATSAAPRASLLKSWGKFLSTWHGEVMPTVPTEPADISHVGCIMKGLGYRSFASYVCAIKQEHVRSGFAWSAQHELEARGGNRSAHLIVEDLVALRLGVDAVAPEVSPG